MTTPPPAGPQPNSPDRQPHTTITSGTNGLPNTITSHATRRGLPGWTWALVGALIVIAVVVAGVMIAGRNHAAPTPPATSRTGPIPASTPTMPEPTTPEPSPSPTSGPTQIGDWSVEVLEYKPDVTEYLTTYDPPVTLVIEGHRFLGIKLRVTNTGDKADPYIAVAVRLRGTTNGHPLYEPYQIDTVDYRGDDYFDEIPRLEPGESGEGWLFYEVRGDFELTGIDMCDERDYDNPTPWTEVPYPQPTEPTPTPTTTP